MLGAELFQNGDTAGRSVADEFDSCVLFDGADEVVGKTSERGERLLQDDAGHFPEFAGRIVPASLAADLAPAAMNTLGARVKHVGAQGFPEAERVERRQSGVGITSGGVELRYV